VYMLYILHTVVVSVALSNIEKLVEPTKFSPHRQSAPLTGGAYWVPRLSTACLLIPQSSRTLRNPFSSHQRSRTFGKYPASSQTFVLVRINT
jgi:hypothetical protein